MSWVIGSLSAGPHLVWKIEILLVPPNAVMEDRRTAKYNRHVGTSNFFNYCTGVVVIQNVPAL